MSTPAKSVLNESKQIERAAMLIEICLLYTSPSPRD